MMDYMLACMEIARALPQPLIFPAGALLILSPLWGSLIVCGLAARVTVNRKGN